MNDKEYIKLLEKKLAVYYSHTYIATIGDYSYLITNEKSPLSSDEKRTIED